MPTKTEIIKAATDKARKAFDDYVDVQNQAIYDLFVAYSRAVGDEIGKASDDTGKIGITQGGPLLDSVKQSIPGFRKSLADYIKRGISGSVDRGFAAQILSLNAAGIANKLIQLGTSYIGPDGQVIRWNVAKEAFVDSAWSRMNTRAVQATLLWKPGGLAFSERVWDIGWTTQKQMLAIVQRGVMQGTSAAKLSREIRQFLALPDTFRGDVLKDFHPGVGVYKSAYKNALRLTSTELNRAYHQATVFYAQQKDWIDGFIWRCGSAEPCEDCAANKDQFFDKDNVPELPEHPSCRCYMSLSIEGESQEAVMPDWPGFAESDEGISLSLRHRGKVLTVLDAERYLHDYGNTPRAREVARKDGYAW